jgi:hypothetical protein
LKNVLGTQFEVLFLPLSGRIEENHRVIIWSPGRDKNSGYREFKLEIPTETRTLVKEDFVNCKPKGSQELSYIPAPIKFQTLPKLKEN